MTLMEAKLNTQCVVKEINISDEKTKIRILELGLMSGVKVQVKHKSLLKKTLLIVFENSCFTLKENIAKSIVVNYA